MNKVVDKIYKFIFNKEKRITFLAKHGFYKNMTDEDFIKMQFKNIFGYDIDLDNPQTFNEKLQWLKLYDRKPEYTKMVDKYAVKEYVANKIGDRYIIPTLGVWDKFDDIDFSMLPDQFVLKCTHDSGGLIICHDKKKLDMKITQKKIEKSLKVNYYMQNKEWPYKNVKKRIIAEKYMVDESGYELKDYKFFCFNGQPRVMFITKDRGDKQKKMTVDFFDMDFNHLPFERDYPNAREKFVKPKAWNEMIYLSKILSEGIPEIRVDFYLINDKVYFGELTFFGGSGFEKFQPMKWDYILGSWLVLPEKKVIEN